MAKAPNNAAAARVRKKVKKNVAEGIAHDHESGQSAELFVDAEMSAEHPIHAGQSHLQDRPSVDQGEREHRQDEVRGGRSEGSPVACDQAVDGEEAGDLGWRDDGQIQASDRRGRQAEDGVEEQDQHERQPEIRQGAGEQPVVVGHLANDAALPIG